MLLLEVAVAVELVEEVVEVQVVLEQVQVLLLHLVLL